MASWISSAVSTIASSAASVIVEKIIKAGFSYLSNRINSVNQAPDSDVELKRLETALPHIREVMNVSEAMKVIDPSSTTWFEQFRNALEASEDVLDELEYKELEDMVKNQDKLKGFASGSKKRKLCCTDEDTLRSMREAIIMLDKAVANVDRIHRLAEKLGVCGLSELQREASKVLRRETTSFLTEREVLGRKSEKDKIIGWVKKLSDHHISCLSIVGHGGLGKTTLAQFAYEETRRMKHFDKTIWICVSTNFDVHDITRKILGELGESSYHDKPLNTLHENLKRIIQSKKIFIVLDDVWDDKSRGDWEKLFAPFKFVQKGSKILFTTRMKCVQNFLASVINTEHESLKLEGLGDEDLRLVFNSYAFNGYGSNDREDLQAIGDQIIKMLKGSPLAAKVIGSLLNSCMDHHYWSRFLSRDSLFNLEEAKNVMDVLKLSYYHLPSDLQACFKFCSIFHQDHKFDKDELIKMWMAAGFFDQQSGKKKLEEIGEDYFNHLLRKSFFEHAQTQSSYSRDLSERYVMHDLLHDLAQNVANGECCRIKLNDKGSFVPSSVRHISIHETEIEKIYHLENLRSLVITTSFQWKQAYFQRRLSPFILPANLMKRTLRLLKIYSERSCKLPEEISVLVHLRYLSIVAGPDIKCFLPTTLNKLYHLQTLELLPKEVFPWVTDTTRITDQFNLRYLDLPEDIMQTIHEVHKLRSVQKLTFYVGKENGKCINELIALNNLRNLSICNIANVEGPFETKSVDLMKKKNLTSLSLKWTEDYNVADPEQIIDNLHPHPNRLNLTIKKYKRKRSPERVNELQHSNLISLHLQSCPMWKDRLFSYKMPYLKILQISNMPKLEKIPNLPLSLCQFKVRNVGLTSLPNLYECSGNSTTVIASWKSLLKVVEIIQCPSLKSLNGFLQQANLDLQAVEKLTIMHCEELVDLPFQGFGNLMSLNNLTLRDCPKLVIVESHGNLLPERLQALNMANCGELDDTLFKASSGLTNLNKLIVSHSENITSITVSKSSFRSLKKLEIFWCANLVELSFSEATYGMNQNNNVSNMASLVIIDCPNLTTFPNLPLSLSSLSILCRTSPRNFPDDKSVCGPCRPSIVSYYRPAQGTMHIENCQNLILTGIFLQETMKFQSFKSLHIDSCINLVQLPSEAFGKFLSLKNLKISHCPNLTELPNLPLSLTSFTIKEVGLSALPEYFQNSDSIEDPSTTSQEPSLRNVNIQDCQNLISLNGFVQQEIMEFKFLESINIYRCENLVQLPIGAFGKFVSLTRLEILDCPMLEVDVPRNLLPAKLEYLKIGNCGKFDVTLLESASRLTTLTTLFIFNSKNITHIPCSESAFKSLRHLSIIRCDKLVEQSSREQAHRDNLQMSTSPYFKITDLHINHLCLLLTDPFRSLRFVSKLYVHDCSKIATLPEQWLLQNSSTLRVLHIEKASSVKSLSVIIERLTSLESLSINKAVLLEELPKLPTSLKSLSITDARSLKSLPPTMASLTALENLEIENAYLLEELPELPPSLSVKRVWGSGGRFL